MITIASKSTSNQSTNQPGSKKASKVERVNTALRAALYMHEDSTERWRKLRDEGAHDNQIWHALLKEFGGGGSSQTTSGGHFAYQGGDGAAQPKFWFSCGTHYTTQKPTLSGKRLVKRVRELLEISPLDDTAKNSDASEQSYDAHEFTPQTDRKTICSICFQGRNGKAHPVNSATLAGSSDASGSSWEERKKLLDAACGADCGHTDEENAAFDDGLGAGERGADEDLCPYSDSSLRLAWLSGYCVGVNNRVATSRHATNGDDAAAPPITSTQEIDVELSDADYKTKSRSLAFLRLQIEELQAEQKKTNDSYKQRIGGLEEQCQELFRSVRRGRDTLSLEVFERRDFERKVVETVRVDSLAVVQERAMTLRETQQSLLSI